jgi:hypothetical protein
MEQVHNKDVAPAFNPTSVKATNYGVDYGKTK